MTAELISSALVDPSCTMGVGAPRSTVAGRSARTPPRPTRRWRHSGPRWWRCCARWTTRPAPCCAPPQARRSRPTGCRGPRCPGSRARRAPPSRPAAGHDAAAPIGRGARRSQLIAGRRHTVIASVPGEHADHLLSVTAEGVSPPLLEAWTRRAAEDLGEALSGPASSSASAAAYGSSSPATTRPARASRSSLAARTPPALAQRGERDRLDLAARPFRTTAHQLAGLLEPRRVAIDLGQQLVDPLPRAGDGLQDRRAPPALAAIGHREHACAAHAGCGRRPRGRPC